MLPWCKKMAEPDFGSSPAIELRRERSFNKAHQGRESRSNRRSAMATVTGRTKPTMELYKPPSRRMSSNLDGMNYLYQPETAFHINGFMDPRENRIQHSKSSGNVTSHSPPRVHFQLDTKPKKSSPPSSNQSPTKFKSQATIQMATPSCETVSERPSERPSSILKRSKSLGATDLIRFSETTTDDSTDSSNVPELDHFGNFSADVQAAISKALQDPNKLSGRHLMEIVRHIFTRLIESSRLAEPASKLVITIIERENNSTFLEALLNTCREWFQEKDRLLKPGSAAPHRWVAFITFLNEMYLQLKRREHQLLKQAKIEGVSPCLVLLSLLCECCQASLKSSTLSLSETECLFFVLTSIGRDIEMEIPAKLQGILTALRDSFLNGDYNSSVRKTLLQLIELQAARWQLSAAAVMYYYPSSAAR